MTNIPVPQKSDDHKRALSASEHADKTERASGQVDEGNAGDTALESAEDAEAGASSSKPE